MAGENCAELGADCPKTGPDCPKVAPTAERGAEDRPQSNASLFPGRSASRTDVDSRSTANSRLAPTTATDPGSDDLAFTWEWGDGSPTAARTYFNDRPGHLYPSPGGIFLFTATDMKIHAYSMAGGHMVTLRIGDDDGGTASYTFTLGIWQQLSDGLVDSTGR